MGDIKIKVSKTIQLDLRVKATIRNENDIDDLLDEIRERIEGSFSSFDDDSFDDEEDKPKFLMENGTLFKLGLNGQYWEVIDDEDYESFEQWKKEKE